MNRNLIWNEKRIMLSMYDCRLLSSQIACTMRQIISLIPSHAALVRDAVYALMPNQNHPPTHLTPRPSINTTAVMCFSFSLGISSFLHHQHCVALSRNHPYPSPQTRLVPGPPSVNPVPCPFSHSPISTWYAFRFKSSWFQLCTLFIFGLQLSVGLGRISPWLFRLPSGMRIGSAALACARASA